MKEVFQLVGETAAQSIWNLSAGAALTPLLSTVDIDGQANYMRLAMDDTEEAIRYGHDKLERQEEGKLGAVFIADGYITLDSGTTDAIVVEVRVYHRETIKCQLVIPYRSANSANGFAIHRPQVTALENIDEIKMQPLLDAFFTGVKTHDQGGKIWHEFYRGEADFTESPNDSLALNADDWHLVQQIPFLVFFLIAAPQGKARKADLKIFEDIFAGAAKYQSTVLNRMIPYGCQNYQQIVEHLDAGNDAYLDNLERAISKLPSQFSRQEIKSFKLALIALAQELLQLKEPAAATAGLRQDNGKMLLARLIVALEIELDS